MYTTPRALCLSHWQALSQAMESPESRKVKSADVIFILAE